MAKKSSKLQITLQCFNAQTIQTVQAYKEHLLNKAKSLYAKGLVNSDDIEMLERLNLLHCCIDSQQLYDTNIYLSDILDSYLKVEEQFQHEAMQNYQTIGNYEAFEICLQNLWSWTNAKIASHQVVADFIHRIAEDIWNHEHASIPMLEPYNNQYGIVVCDNRIFINYFDKHTMVFAWPNIDDYSIAKVEDAFQGMTLKFENSRRDASYKAIDNEHPFDFRSNDWNIVAKSYVLGEKLFNNPSWQQILRRWRTDTFNLNQLRSSVYLVYRAYLRTFSRICCEKTLNGITYIVEHDIQNMQPTVTEQLYTKDRQIKFDDWKMKLSSVVDGSEYVSYIDALACFLFKCEYTTCAPNSMLLNTPQFT